MKFKLSVIAAAILVTTGCVHPQQEEDGSHKQTRTKSIDNVVGQSDFELVRINMLDGFVARQVRMANKESKTVPVLALEYIDSMRADGSWEGVDYASQNQNGWTPRTHLNNMRMIAAAFVQTGDQHFADAAVQAMDYWFKVKPGAHWWWEDIGKPQFLGEVALMLGDELPMHLRFETAMIMPTTPGVRPSDGKKVKGGNRSDINLGVIYRGLLLQNKALVADAVQNMEDAIFIANDSEGLQADYSFHAHGAQLYSSYGEVWFNATLRMAYILRDTQWRFSEEKTDMLANFLLDGWRWMKRGQYLDYNAWGRSISRPKAPIPPLKDVVSQPPTSDFGQMDMVAALTPERAAEAMTFKAHVAGARQGVPSGLNGFKHFWRSDYSTKMADDYFFGIRMNSTRTVPNESGNGENQLGYWLGYGSTFLEQRGDEYHNIFPVWNWTMLPGVTAPEYEGPAASWGTSRTKNTKAFVGGVSDGRYGVSVMDLDVNTKVKDQPDFTTQAKKSWFSFDDEIIALGAGISSSSSANVNTTLNQTLLNGKVTVDGVVVEQGSHDASSANWVHHDGVGYIFLEKGSHYLSNQTQTGNWARIKENASKDEVTKDVFTLRIAHGVQPDNEKYQYVIAPGQTAEQTAAYQQSLPVKVLQNNESIQAVHHTALKVTGIVFYQAGSIQISPDLSVSIDHPGLVLVDESGKEPVITISTPDHSYAHINLTLESSFRGKATQQVITHGEPGLQGHSVSFPFYQGAEASNQVFREEMVRAEAKVAEKARIEAEAQAKAQAEAEARAETVAKARAAAIKTLAKGELELIVKGDGHIRGGKQVDNNFGGASYMGAENHAENSSLEYRAVFNFDTTGLAGINATSAKLKFYLRKIVDRDDKAVKPIRLQAFAFNAGQDWSEHSMTWNKLPDMIGAPASNILTLTESQTDEWVELDVTNVVNTLNMESNLNLVLVNIDEKGQGGFVHISPREEKVDGVAGTLAARLMIQGELRTASD